MLRLPATLAREIEARTRDALPEEACGLLLGIAREEVFDVKALCAARNVALVARTSFELDALDLLAADEAARAGGLSILGAWHSHPRGPLAASAQDRLGAPATWLTLIAVPRPRAGIDMSCRRNQGELAVRIEIARADEARV